jgi:hypothetical protein
MGLHLWLLIVVCKFMVLEENLKTIYFCAFITCAVILRMQLEYECYDLGLLLFIFKKDF